MNTSELSERIKMLARDTGFDLAGVAPLDDLPELKRLATWLERGYAGEMDYLADPRRPHPQQVLAGARSAIVVGLIYSTAHPYSTEVPLSPERGWISRYAWGDDYHHVVREKLERLLDALRAEISTPFAARSYVDTGPVMERALAKYAGLGWLAKNTCVLNAEAGSWFFLGVILTTLELAPDSPLPDQCGSCTLCLEACPTGAIVEPYLLDARRCISYLTIELRGPIPEDLRGPMGRHVFGCDICQDVCPYNRPTTAGGRAPITHLAAFEPRAIEIPSAKKEPPEPRGSCLGEQPSVIRSETKEHGPRATEQQSSLFHPQLEWLARLPEEGFRRVFRKSAVKRAKWRGLLRNVLVAMGNSSNPRFRPLLERFAASEDPLLTEHARWALERLQPSEER